MSATRRPEDYMAEDYPVLVSREPGTGDFLVEVPDWPGCLAHGTTLEEAFRSLEEARYTWVEDCLERGLDVPPPRAPETYSGKFLLRLPRSLHRRLTTLAAQDGTSLNSYISTVLAEHAGASGATQALRAVRDEVQAVLREIRSAATNVTSVVSVQGWPAFEVSDFMINTGALRPRLRVRDLMQEVCDPRPIPVVMVPDKDSLGGRFRQ